MAIQGATLLAAENRELRAANEKQKRKRERYCIYIGQENALTIKEGLNRVRGANKDEIESIKISKEQLQKRTASCYSVYDILEHTARTCS
jgi:hypothetical protein